jgi:hypothetical protein
MNTGKIMIGFPLVLLSVAMMGSPSGAAGTKDSCEVGCRISLAGVESRGLTAMHHGHPAASTGSGPRTNATHPYER